MALRSMALMSLWRMLIRSFERRGSGRGEDVSP